jgi:hypothetical protein
MIEQLFFLVKVLLLSVLISVLIKYGFLNLAIDYPVYSSLILIFSPVIILGSILFLRQRKLS